MAEDADIVRSHAATSQYRAGYVINSDPINGEQACRKPRNQYKDRLFIC